MSSPITLFDVEILYKNFDVAMFMSFPVYDNIIMPLVELWGNDVTVYEVASLITKSLWISNRLVRLRPSRSVHSLT